MAVEEKTITRATCDAKQTTTLTLNIQLGGKTNFSKYSPCNSSTVQYILIRNAKSEVVV